MSLLDPVSMRASQMGRLTVWTNEDEGNPGWKIRREKVDLGLRDRAETRQDTCWAPDCPRKPSVWVREVRFDLGEGSRPHERACVDTGHYSGPIPGFCFAHLATQPAELAKLVYFDHPAMAWGFRPTRWFVIGTDSSVIGAGTCLAIDETPFQTQPEIRDEVLSCA